LYLNTFSQSADRLDLTGSEDFANVLIAMRERGLEPALPIACHSRNVVAGGLRFHVMEWGDDSKPPVLMLHGGNQTAHVWDMVAAMLCHDFHIFALDQRGHGDSEWPRDGETSTELMADDVLGVMQALGLEHPIVVGHSMGGRAALNLVTRYDVTKRLVLVDTGPESTLAGRQQIVEFVRSTREFDSVDDYLARLQEREPGRSHDRILRTMRYNLMQRADGKLVSKQFPRLGNPGAPLPPRPPATPEELARVKCPVLLIRGGESPLIAADAAEKFVAQLPDGRLESVAGAGHNVHTQKTAEFLELLRPFLLQA
jgi:pimeloyl-ACP methyl ester carboxylesterase